MADAYPKATVVASASRAPTWPLNGQSVEVLRSVIETDTDFDRLLAKSWVKTADGSEQVVANIELIY